MFKCLAGDENLPSTGLINSNYPEKKAYKVSLLLPKMILL